MPHGGASMPCSGASMPCRGPSMSSSGASLPSSGGTRRWDVPDWDRSDCGCDRGEARLGGDLTEEKEELRVVETLVAGLLEENAKLGSTVKQLQVRIIPQ